MSSTLCIINGDGQRHCIVEGRVTEKKLSVTDAASSCDIVCVEVRGGSAVGCLINIGFQFRGALHQEWK